MISDKTRKLLSIAAKRNNFGGRVYTPGNHVIMEKDIDQVGRQYISHLIQMTCMSN